MAIYYI